MLPKISDLKIKHVVFTRISLARRNLMATVECKGLGTYSLWQGNSPSQRSLQIIEGKMTLWWAACLPTGQGFLHFTKTVLNRCFYSLFSHFVLKMQFSQTILLIHLCIISWRFSEVSNIDKATLLSGNTVCLNKSNNHANVEPPQWQEQ